MSSQQNKNRAPLSAKQPAIKKTITAADVFRNEMDLDPDLVAEIKAKGLGYRFINATQFRKTGSHKARWVPYKRDAKTVTDSIFGADPDGYIRNGDLILAVKPQEKIDQHRAYLREKAASLSGINKKHAEEFREFAKESGVKSHISEGYGQDDEGDED